MAKISRSIPSSYLFLALFVSLVAMFWAITEDLLKGFEIGAIVLAAALGGVAVIFVIALVPLAIHEAGHYLAGRRVGFQFLVGVVGPFGWRQEGERIVSFRSRPATLNGYVAMSPPDERDVERRYAWFVAGGPLASLAWVGVVFALWSLSGLPVSTQIPTGSGFRGLLQMGFEVVALGALLMLPGTLLPFRIKALGSLPSDMMRLIILRRGGDEARSLFANLSLTRMLRAGIPVRDLPLVLLEEAERTPNDDAQKLGALQMRWGYELNHDPQAAEKTVARILTLAEKLRKSLPGDWFESIELIQAEQAAYIRYDADEAERRIAKVDSALPNLRLVKAILEAAIASIRRDSDRLERIAQAERVLEEVAGKTTVNLEFERKWLAAMRTEWPPRSTETA